MSGTILLATDGSTPALAATIKAVGQARDRKARLVVLTVREPTPITSMEKLAEASVLQRKQDIDGVEYARKVAGTMGVQAEYLSKEGPVVAQIIRTASSLNADLIVIGSSDPRGISGFLLGNVAGALVDQAPCSVMVVKPTEAEIKAALELATEAKEEKPRIEITDITGSKKFKVGLGLFAIYIVGYALFTTVGSFAKGIFRIELLGLNVALIYGMILIITAIVMAIGYNWYVGREEAKTGGA